MAATSTSSDFWLDRLAQAIDNARVAPSDRSRRAYLELARHYRAMHELINGRNADANARFAFNRLQAAEVNGAIGASFMQAA